MNTEGLVGLRAYWETLRAGRLAPYRAELDPRAFEAVLNHMFILEQTGPGGVRVRLGGQALCEMMGMEVRGMPPEAFIDAAHRVEFQGLMQKVLSVPSVAEIELTAIDSRGRQMKAQMLLLPLRSDFGEVSRIMGCVVTERTAVRAPANFSISGARVDPIIGVDDGAGSATPGFAEAAPVFAGPAVREVVDNPAPIVSQPRRGHLRVIRED